MVFSSFTFMALFLPVVLLLHFTSKNPAWRNGVLLAASLVFYAWGEPRFVLVMLLSILANYLAAGMCERSESKAARRLWMLVGVGVSLAFLFWFKYYAFLVNSVCGLFGLPAKAQPRTLPIGISFYTFQIITYTVDVYRGKVPAQRNPVRLALYISFFPQLIAGPIVNYSDVEPQLVERRTTWSGVYKGLSRFVIGLGKKVLIANVCGEILSALTLTGGTSMLTAWLGAIAYSLQIYFDFSGYSDMAVGCARALGYDLPRNFNLHARKACFEHSHRLDADRSLARRFLELYRLGPLLRAAADLGEVSPARCARPPAGCALPTVYAAAGDARLGAVLP